MFGSRHFQALKNNEIAVLSHHQIIGSASVSFPMNKKRWKLLIHRWIILWTGRRCLYYSFLPWQNSKIFKNCNIGMFLFSDPNIGGFFVQKNSGLGDTSRIFFRWPPNTFETSDFADPCSSSQAARVHHPLPCCYYIKNYYKTCKAYKSQDNYHWCSIKSVLKNFTNPQKNIYAEVSF